MKITNDIYFVGADEHNQQLFENLHPVKNGVSYNSYLLLDEKTVLFDTVDWSVAREFLDNIKLALDGRELDFLVINHMEPDHCACIEEVILRYPNIKIITNKKACEFMKQFGFDIDNRVEFVAENSEISFGKHTIKFIMAPMVHWPEAMVCYDLTEKILFSADAFGTFGELSGRKFLDEFSNQDEMICEYRRYYTNIVGKFGSSVQMLLKKVSNLEIEIICPLHGPVIRKDINILLEKYNLWSTYKPENQGVLIIYGSMYGNTESACKKFASELYKNGIKDVKVLDVSNTDMSTLVAESFRYSHIVLGSVTYNADLYPPMHNYLCDIKALNLQNRTFGIIENGTWAIVSGKKTKEIIETMKNMTILENIVTIKSKLNDSNNEQINLLINEIKNTL